MAGNSLAQEAKGTEKRVVHEMEFGPDTMDPGRMVVLYMTKELERQGIGGGPREKLICGTRAGQVVQEKNKGGRW